MFFTTPISRSLAGGFLSNIMIPLVVILSLRSFYITFPDFLTVQMHRSGRSRLMLRVTIRLIGAMNKFLTAWSKFSERSRSVQYCIRCRRLADFLQFVLLAALSL